VDRGPKAETGWWAEVGEDLVLLDPGLATSARVPVGTQWTAGQAVDSRLGLVAVSDRAAVRVVAIDGTPLWSFAHETWGLEYLCGRLVAHRHRH
jgi:hypothetical protein